MLGDICAVTRPKGRVMRYWEAWNPRREVRESRFVGIHLSGSARVAPSLVEVHVFSAACAKQPWGIQSRGNAPARGKLQRSVEARPAATGERAVETEHALVQVGV